LVPAGSVGRSVPVLRNCVRALGGHFLSKIGQLPALLIQHFDLSLAVLNPQVNNGLHMFGIDGPHPVSTGQVA
jgi:hypothetical protein